LLKERCDREFLLRFTSDGLANALIGVSVQEHLRRQRVKAKRICLACLAKKDVTAHRTLALDTSGQRARSDLWKVRPWNRQRQSYVRYMNDGGEIQDATSDEGYEELETSQTKLPSVPAVRHVRSMEGLGAVAPAQKRPDRKSVPSDSMRRQVPPSE